MAQAQVQTQPTAVQRAADVVEALFVDAFTTAADRQEVSEVAIWLELRRRGWQVPDILFDTTVEA